MPRSTLVLLPFVCLSVALGHASASTRYVDVGLGSGANDGTSWADAHQGVDGLSAALTASVAGDEIWVAMGTYKPTATLTRTIYITLKTGVAVYGGFAGGETLLAQRNVTLNPTILSGDLAGNDGSNVFTDNSFHVVNANSATATAILDGFTVTGGNANGSANQDRGGGILMLASSNATIRNCVFASNRCTFGGGAGYINASSPTFTDCRFENNVGGSFGGAFDQATSVGTTFTRCVFSGNTAARAGAIEIFSSSPVKCYDCLFFNNTCTGSGGGGAVFVSGSSPTFRNCTIYGNTATTVAAAGFIASSSTIEIANCIVYGNTGVGGAQAAVNQLSGTTYTVSYSCVQGGFAGTGNIASNPLLVDVPNGDYRLTLASPCIDAGNSSTTPPGITTDLDLNPRVADEPSVPNTGAGSSPFVDLGAYEVRAPIVVSYCPGDGSGTPCPCGNNAPFFAVEGCLNSFGVGGWLQSAGSARVNTDSFVLQGSQMPSSTCLYFQGTQQVGGGLGLAFGDGLRCVGGSVIRLGTKLNVAGASQYPDVGDLSVSVKGNVTLQGSVRNYQIWYRNAAAFCQPETFNLTNGLSVTWEL